MISFIVPAHDEAFLIGGTLAALRRAAASCGEPFEILVVDDSSADATATIAARAGARVVRVEHRHIAATRNSGARAARGELLVFVDADTQVDGAVVRAAVTALREGAVGGGCRVQFDGRLPAWVRLAEPVLVGLMRSARLAAGCFLFCTRAAFESVGGFDESYYAGEEVILSRALGQRGRFVVLAESVRTSGRKFRAHPAGEFLRFFAGVATRGAGATRSRVHLGLWYGARRDDPAAHPADRAA
jgi:glycosyltransferase involved in cell wall biosynthesis